MDYPEKRIVVLTLENAEIGDRPFAPEVARTIREYADMIEHGDAGNRACEVYESQGTKLTVIGASWNGERIPSPAMGTQHLRASEQTERKS